MQSPNTRDRVFVTLHQGQLLRWKKQLAMRGNAWNLTEVCGPQKLFVASEFKRFAQFARCCSLAVFHVDEFEPSRDNTEVGSQPFSALVLTYAGEELARTELTEAAVRTSKPIAIQFHYREVDGQGRVVLGARQGPEPEPLRPSA